MAKSVMTSNLEISMVWTHAPWVRSEDHKQSDEAKNSGIFMLRKEVLAPKANQKLSVLYNH